MSYLKNKNLRIKIIDIYLAKKTFWMAEKEHYGTEIFSLY